MPSSSDHRPGINSINNGWRVEGVGDITADITRERERTLMGDTDERLDND